LFNTDSFGNVYFPAGVSVASIPATTGTQNKVLVPGPNGRISSASISQLITQSGGNLVSSIFGRTGVVTAALGDYNTDQITEGQSLYFSDSRARKVLSVTTFNTSGPATYDSTTGIINIPQYGSGESSPANFVPLTRKISINGQTADLSVDRMFSVEEMVYPPMGIPVSNGTSWAASITNNSANWNTAYGWGDHSLEGYLTSFTETDPIWTAEKVNYYTKIQADARYLQSYTETDPVWTAEKINYYTKTQSDGRYLQSFTETDPIWTSEKTNYALKTYVDTSISNLIDTAPTTLNTLNELAAALGDDANFSTTITTLIGTKEPAITPGTTAQYWRGDKTWQTLPIYTLSGLGGEPSIAAGTTAQYWRGDKSWQTLPIYTLSGLGGQPQLNGTGFVKASGTTITYDNSTYYLASNPSVYISGITDIMVTTALGYTPFSGTGTTNFLARFSSATTLTNSLIYDNGTQVGIGNRVLANLSKIERTLNILGTDSVMRIGRFTDSPTTASPSVELISYSDNGSVRRFFWDYFINGEDSFAIRQRIAGGGVATNGVIIDALRLTVKSGGQIQFNNYTSLTSFTGTVAGYLAFDNSGNIITASFVDTNTWDANTKTVAGYVAAPGAVANKVWKTDASGNPAWRDDADTIYSLPIASASVLGGIKVGSNLSIDGNGVLSAGNSYVLPTASASVLGGIKVGTNLSIDANGVLSSTDTNTTYANFTRTVAGLVPNPGGSTTTRYLREDGTWVIPPDTDTVYVHPTTAGNKHIPAGGAAGQILRYSSDGTAVWGADNDTTYVVFTRSANGLTPAAPAGTGTTRYLREDGTWQVPPDTDTDTNTTYSNFTRTVSGLVPNPGGSSTNRYLREDGTWVVPPDTDTDTNTWNANSRDVAGYVAAPGAIANKVWKTDASGNPAWRDDADTDTNTTYTNGAGLTLSGTTFSVTKTITASETADTIALRNGSGQLVATGFFQASSRTLKTNITPFTRSALDIIREVTVVSFNYKTDVINKHIGFIAEDTPEELSTRSKNVMDSNNTIGVLLKAIQELESRIKTLESK
jgi:hypothetical protein